MKNTMRRARTFFLKSRIIAFDISLEGEASSSSNFSRQTLQETNMVRSKNMNSIVYLFCFYIEGNLLS